MSKEIGKKAKFREEAKIDLKSNIQNPTSLPLTKNYEITIGEETQRLSLDGKITFNNVKDHQVLIKAVGSKITNEVVKIVIATSDDLPVVGTNGGNYKIVIATSDDLPVVGTNGKNYKIVIATSDDLPVVINDDQK